MWFVITAEVIKEKYTFHVSQEICICPIWILAAISQEDADVCALVAAF